MSNCWNSGDGFKAEVDDLRDSSSFKVKSLLELDTCAGLCTDPHVCAPKS